MAFPTSPTDGQQTTINYITYQYDSTNTAWYRVSTGVMEPLANAAFLQANTGSTNAITAGSYANSAFIQANAAFTKANTAGGGSSNARSTINAMIFGN